MKNVCFVLSVATLIAVSIAPAYAKPSSSSYNTNVIKHNLKTAAGVQKFWAANTRF